MRDRLGTNVGATRPGEAMIIPPENPDPMDLTGLTDPTANAATAVRIVPAEAASGAVAVTGIATTSTAVVAAAAATAALGTITLSPTGIQRGLQVHLRTRQGKARATAAISTLTTADIQVRVIRTPTCPVPEVTGISRARRHVRITQPSAGTPVSPAARHP